MKKSFIILSTLCVLFLFASCSDSGNAPREAAASLVGNKQTITWDADTKKAAETVITIKFTNVNCNPAILEQDSAALSEYFKAGDGSTLKDKGLSFKVENGDTSETTALHTLKFTITDSGNTETSLTSPLSGDYSLTIPSSYLTGEDTTVSDKGLTIKNAVSLNLLLPATVTGSSTSSTSYSIKYNATLNWTSSTLTLTLDNCTSTLVPETDTDFNGFRFQVSAQAYELNGIECTAKYTQKTATEKAKITLEFSGTPSYSDHYTGNTRTGVIYVDKDALGLSADSGYYFFEDSLEVGTFSIQGQN